MKLQADLGVELVHRLVFFLPSFGKKNISCDFMLACLEYEALAKGFPLKGKNLLLEEQILSF